MSSFPAFPLTTPHAPAPILRLVRGDEPETISISALLSVYETLARTVRVSYGQKCVSQEFLAAAYNIEVCRLKDQKGLQAALQKAGEIFSSAHNDSDKPCAKLFWAFILSDLILRQESVDGGYVQACSARSQAYRGIANALLYLSFSHRTQSGPQAGEYNHLAISFLYIDLDRGDFESYILRSASVRKMIKHSIGQLAEHQARSILLPGRFSGFAEDEIGLSMDPILHNLSMQEAEGMFYAAKKSWQKDRGIDGIAAWIAYCRLKEHIAQRICAGLPYEGLPGRHAAIIRAQLESYRQI